MAGRATDKTSPAKREQHRSNARQLAAAGFTDHAVAHYIKGEAFVEAARLLDEAGRDWEAIHVLLAAVTFDLEQLRALSGEKRLSAITLAALLQRSGEDQKSTRLLAGLGALSADEASIFQGAAHPRSPKVARVKPKRAVQSRAPKSHDAPRTSGMRVRQKNRTEPRVPVDRVAFEDMETPPSGSPMRDFAEAIEEIPIPRPARVPLSGLRRPASPEFVVETIRTTSDKPSEPPSRTNIDRSITQLVAAGRMEQAAEVAYLARRYEEASNWFSECGLHHRAGASLRALGRYEEAVAHLTLTKRDGPHYREACREIARAGLSAGRLTAHARDYVFKYVESGPRSDIEIPAFLDYAELFWAANIETLARRCVASVLRLAPDHDGAQMLKVMWDARPARSEEPD